MIGLFNGTSTRVGIQQLLCSSQKRLIISIETSSYYVNMSYLHVVYGVVLVVVVSFAVRLSHVLDPHVFRHQA